MILVEKASVEDISLIQKIAHTTWYPTFKDILSEQQIEYMLEMMYSTSSLKEQIEVKNHVFFIAKQGDLSLGFMSIELNYNYKPKAKIHKIYILPTAQGKGIGNALMQKAEEFALEHKQDSITLNVNRFNKAIGFYQKQGYQNIRTENIDIGKGYVMEDYVFEKPL